MGWLEYLSLVILCLGLTMVFFAFVYLHDLPHAIAKKRHHPHEEAIHAACWLSLFTLHAIWPLVFIWSIARQGPMTVRVENAPGGGPELGDRLAGLEQRLAQLEKKT